MTSSGASTRPPSQGPIPGRWVCTTAIVGTGAFAATQLAALAVPSGAVLAVAVGWSLTLFFAGSGAFLVALVVAAARSRDAEVTLAGLVWLSRAAPPAVSRVLRGAVIAQVLIAVISASIRPFTALAFGILVPMFGLGCNAWWAARHGTFAPIGGAEAAESPSGPTDASVVGEAAPTRQGAPARPSREDPDDFDDLFRRRRRKQ